MARFACNAACHRAYLTVIAKEAPMSHTKLRGAANHYILYLITKCSEGFYFNLLEV